MRGFVAPALVSLASLALVAITGACGEGDSHAAAGTPFTVWIYDERLTTDGEDKPVPGVRVAFDPAGGGDRVTMTTAPDGHVTFNGDFTQGGASVTVFSPNHVFVTMLEASPQTAAARANTVGKPPEDLVIVPPRLDSVTAGLTVELRGSIFGKLHPTSQVAISASGLPRVGTVQTAETAYAVRALRGRKFFVLGQEVDSVVDRDGNLLSNDLLRSFRIDLPARADDERLDLDLATVPLLPIKPLRFHAESPKAVGSPFVAGTRAYASVQSADSGLTPGVYSFTKPSADGRAFDINVKLAQTDIAPERVVTQAELVAPDGSRSIRTEQGIAGDGTAWTDFPMPPTVANPDAIRHLSDAIPLDGFPAGADLVAEVLAADQLFWILYGPPGGPRAKSFIVPAQDEVSNNKVVLFALSLSARMDRVALPMSGELYRRVGVLRDLAILK